MPTANAAPGWWNHIDSFGARLVLALALNHLQDKVRNAATHTVRNWLRGAAQRMQKALFLHLHEKHNSSEISLNLELESGSPDKRRPVTALTASP
jgi:hypothetical protein